MLQIHPKTSGAALCGALGVLIVAILHSISGVHLAPEAYAAIPTFLSTLGAWLVPSPPVVWLVPSPPVVAPGIPSPVEASTPPPGGLPLAPGGLPIGGSDK